METIGSILSHRVVSLCVDPWSELIPESIFRSSKVSNHPGSDGTLRNESYSGDVVKALCGIRRNPIWKLKVPALTVVNAFRCVTAKADTFFFRPATILPDWQL